MYKITWTWWQLELTRLHACCTSSKAFFRWFKTSLLCKSITQTASIRILPVLEDGPCPEVSLRLPTLSVISKIAAKIANGKIQPLQFCWLWEASKRLKLVHYLKDHDLQIVGQLQIIFRTAVPEVRETIQNDATWSTTSLNLLSGVRVHLSP